MRFGFMEDFRNPIAWRRPWAEFYRDVLDQIALGETLGYDNVWLTEHHFTDDGYNPSLMTTAAAVAMKTERIRIGTFILLLPYQHPLLVAEEVANVDILSNGRFDFGIGQGYSYHEFNTLCMDRSERGKRMREHIDIIKRLFTEERVSYDGQFTQIKDARITPPPVQQPYPPIWIGARGPKAIKNAAKLGYHLMATLGPDPAPLYIDTLKEEGRNPDDFNICQLRMVYCAPTEEQAWDDTEEHVFHMLEFYQDILSNANDAEGDDNPLPVTKPADIRNSILRDHFMIGTPDQVNEKMQQFCADYRCTDFIMATQFPGIEVAKANRALELFAAEVMPNFRDA
ncbi:MAG: LLM class flavin-dependent oxidoreductase [Pseudomonadota bacterium]